MEAGNQLFGAEADIKQYLFHSWMSVWFPLISQKFWKVTRTFSNREAIGVTGHQNLSHGLEPESSESFDKKYLPPSGVSLVIRLYKCFVKKNQLEPDATWWVLLGPFYVDCWIVTVHGQDLPLWLCTSIQNQKHPNMLLVIKYPKHVSESRGSDMQPFVGRYALHRMSRRGRDGEGFC